MIRGLEFFESNESNINRVLCNVLSMEDLSRAKLQIIEDEIIVNEDEYNITLQRPCEVADDIEKKDPYIIFLNLQLFPCEAEVIEINDYQEFLSSSCLLIFLIVDVNYVEIYAKDETLRQNIAKILETCGCDFSWKTNENDGRTGFHLF